MGARRLRRLALGAAHRRKQDVAQEGGLAGARDAGQADQGAQREVNVDPLEVVGAGAADPQEAAAGRRQAVAAGYLQASAEVAAGQGFGPLQIGDRARELDAAALATGPGAQIDDVIGGADHRRVVLDDQQGVAGIAEAVQHADQPVDVAVVQADAGLVQHEQRVDELGT